MSRSLTKKATPGSHLTCISLGLESSSVLTRADCQCLVLTSPSVTSCWWLDINPKRVLTQGKLVNSTHQGLPTHPSLQSPLLNIYNSPVFMVSNLSDANPRRHAANVGQKVTLPESGLGLHQQMGKLGMLVATASAITQLAVVAVPVCVCTCV